jgi:CBS domain-containing protein
MAKRARDVMQTHVISVDADKPLIDVHHLFLEEEIDGAPVLDDAGKVQGVITIRDLLRALEEEPDAADETDYMQEYIELPGIFSSVSAEFRERLGSRTVAEFMTRSVVSVAPEAPLAEVARTLRSHRIHRVLVVEKGLLVGLITTFDLISVLEEGREKH